MGTRLLADELILKLCPVRCEEIEHENGTAYRYLPTEDKEYPTLAPEDREILDAVIERFGGASLSAIFRAMHREDAYRETALYGIIQYGNTRTLSLS